MNNITMQEMMDYTRFTASRKEVYGKKVTRPFYLKAEDLKKDADPVDRWIAYLSSYCKRTGSKDAERVLLIFENYDTASEPDFKFLDGIISEENKYIS